MADTQRSLFQSEPGLNSQPVSLTLRSGPGRPLTPAQRMFNRLTTQVDQLRRKLEKERRSLDTALAYYGEHLHPREQRCAALRKDIVRIMATVLDSGHMKDKRDRRVLREIIGEQLDFILQEGGPIEDSDLRALFERTQGTSYEALEREEVNEMRSMMESMFADIGVDIDLSDLRPDMNPEEIARKMAEMSDTVRQKMQENEDGSRQQGHKKTKRQLKQEERMRQAEEVRKKSITSIYRQLAKVLHPDLEPDETRRVSKVALMQELTTAYHRNDLHTLLRLELEWIQREEGNLDRLTNEKLAIYNQLLNDQLFELKSEIQGLPYHPRYAPIVVMDDFDFHLRTDGPAEAHRLDIMIRDMEMSLANMRNGHAEKEIRFAIKEYRAATRRRREFERDCPF